MKKNKILRMLVAPIVLSLLFLSGCDTTESTMGGGALGTAAGAGVGYALGGKGGAILGGVLGGLGGGALGHNAGRTNEKKAALEEENARLRAEQAAWDRRRLRREAHYDYNDDDDYYDYDVERYVRRERRRARYGDEDDEDYYRPSKRKFRNRGVSKSRHVSADR